jgi:hypothetical protein
MRATFQTPRKDEQPIPILTKLDSASSKSLNISSDNTPTSSALVRAEMEAMIRGDEYSYEIRSPTLIRDEGVERYNSIRKSQG